MLMLEYFLDESSRSVDREIIYWSAMFYSVQPESQQQACIPDVSMLCHIVLVNMVRGKSQPLKSASCYCHSAAIVTLLACFFFFLSFIFNMTKNGKPPHRQVRENKLCSVFTHKVLAWIVNLYFGCMSFSLGHNFYSQAQVSWFID